MINLDYFKELIIISTIISTISCMFIQKTKILFNSSKYLIYYSLFINIIIGLFYSNTFTDISFPDNLWIGIFSFIEADSFYKTIEPKINSHRDIKEKNKQFSVNKK